MVIFDAPMVAAALEDMTFVMDMKNAWMVQMKEWIVSLYNYFFKLSIFNDINTLDNLITVSYDVTYAY